MAHQPNIYYGAFGDSPALQSTQLDPQKQQERLIQHPFDTMLQQQQQHQQAHSSELDQVQAQGQISPALAGASGGPLEQELGFNSLHRSHSPFPPPFMHPNMVQLMQQNHLQQQHMFLQQQHQQALGQPFHHTQELGSTDAGQGEQQHPSIHGSNFSAEQGVGAAAATTETDIRFAEGDRVLPEDERRSLMDRPHSMDSPQLRQGVHHPLAPQHPRPMFNLPGSPGPHNFDSEFGGPAMVPIHGPFLHVNGMTPPPGFGRYPMHPMQAPPFQPSFHQQQQQQQQQQFHHQQQQMFMHQQILHQQQQQMLQMQQFQSNTQHPLNHEPGRQGQDHSSLNQHRDQSPALANTQDQSGSAPQQNQIKDIESQINLLLFKGDTTEGAAHQSLHLGGRPEKPSRPLSGLTVQEIEEAQVKDLQSQMRRFSLNDPVSPPRSRSIPSVEDHVDGSGPNADQEPLSAEGQRLSKILDSRFQTPMTSGVAPRYEQTTEKAPFSAKDIDFYSDQKYDPYRPSEYDFASITRGAQILCRELMPKDEEETRKLALLQRLSDIANEVFGKAEVLPFGSSGNGLALANADMDVCVFLNSPEGEEEVSPVEFVERIGDRLEKDSEFENILQLKRARVPIVKLNHVNGIACDIGYQNDLAIWNTRLLRAYCRIDTRLRDIAVVIKQWAKRRKINNPYTGSLSSYAYVLLVIHVLQRRGVLPNLQSIVVGNNGKIPYWDCQGFNRYFFEDIPNLGHFWQATPEASRQTVGELLYEFFRYFASEFKYTTHVVSIRNGGLLTKESKEWTKDHTQLQQQQQQSQSPVPSEAATSPNEAQPAVDSKPVVKNRYLFCIEDPFELNHNVGRPVDGNSLYDIRGEFMRAAKILSKGGDGAIMRLCDERNVHTRQERNRLSSIDHGDDRGRDKHQYHRQSKDRINSPSLGLDNSRADGRRGSAGGGGAGRMMAFPTGEDKPQEGSRANSIPQGTVDGVVAENAVSGSNEQGGQQRQRVGRRTFYKRATIAGEPRHFTKA